MMLDGEACEAARAAEVQFLHDAAAAVFNRPLTQRQQLRDLPGRHRLGDEPQHPPFGQRQSPNTLLKVHNGNVAEGKSVARG